MNTTQPGFGDTISESKWRVIYEDPETRQRESIILTEAEYQEFCSNRENTKGYGLVPITVNSRLINLPKNAFKGEVEILPKRIAISGEEMTATRYDMCKWSPEEMKEWARCQAGVLGLYPFTACSEKLFLGLAKSVFNWDQSSKLKQHILEVGERLLPTKQDKVQEPETVKPPGSSGSFDSLNSVMENAANS